MELVKARSADLPVVLLIPQGHRVGEELVAILDAGGADSRGERDGQSGERAVVLEWLASWTARWVRSSVAGPSCPFLIIRLLSSGMLDQRWVTNGFGAEPLLIQGSSTMIVSTTSRSPAW